MTQAALPPADNGRGAILLACAAAAFTAEVTMVRQLSPMVSDAQVVFARAAVQLLTVGCWVLLRDPALARTRRPALHLARGLTSLACWALYYRSFQTLDLALATTLTFTTSLFVVALAGPVLGERVGLRRWGLTVLGFAGVALAAQPGAGGLEPGVLLGLASAGFASALVFLNRILSRTEATATIMLWIGIVATLGTLPGLIADGRIPGLADLALLGLAGGFGTLGMLLTVSAYRVGEVSALAPFPYLRLVFAIAAGWLVFAEMPDAATLGGGAIIVGCALLVGRTEATRGLRAPHR
jgi:drug/metabolite transporter (DMT)-like permease